MTKIKNTKRALIVNVIVLLICVSMLIGSTFAWFTDSASTAVNSIQSGILKIQLLDAEDHDLNGQTLSFIKAAGAPADEAILWEPGCTYNLPDIYVKNNGNLALKFKIEVSGIIGDAKLNEAIDWTMSNADVNGEYHLAAGAKTEAITISGHMKESAGNEYQGLSISGIAITVIAIQDTVEYDSYNNQYDAAATYPIVDAAKLTEALNNIQPSQVINIGVDEPVTLDSELADGVTIAGQGAGKTTIVIPNVNNNGYVVDKENVTFSGLKIDGNEVPNKGTYNGVLQINEGGTTIEGCEIVGGGMSTWNSSVLVWASAAGEKTEIKNTKISGAFRGILLESGNGELVVDGCDITAIYPISIDGGSATAELKVSNSALKGWTSYSAIKSAVFTNVKFGFGCGYGYLRPYCSTSFSGCSFDDGFKMGCGNIANGSTFTFTNCTYNGVKLTAENFLTLLFDSGDSGEYGSLTSKATVTVDGTTVVYQ